MLFSDVTGSTALGEKLEPESLRRMLAQFFETARRVIESHGGTVEKFIGDAVMAVFGVPVVHEDDALRALRAARDLMASLETINAEFHAYRGEYEPARALFQQMATGFRERGMPLAAAISQQVGIAVERTAGDLDAAITAGLESCEELEQAGETAFSSTNAAFLSHVLFLAGRHHEAEEWAKRAGELGDPHDRVTHIIAGNVRALLAAARGEEQARQLIADALALAEPVQSPQTQGESALDAAAVYRLLGDTDAERRQLEHALEQFTDKGSTVYVDFTTALLDDLAART